MTLGGGGPGAAVSGAGALGGALFITALELSAAAEVWGAPRPQARQASMVRATSGALRCMRIISGLPPPRWTLRTRCKTSSGDCHPRERSPAILHGGQSHTRPASLEEADSGLAISTRDVP